MIQIELGLFTSAARNAPSLSTASRITRPRQTWVSFMQQLSSQKTRHSGIDPTRCRWTNWLSSSYSTQVRPRPTVLKATTETHWCRLGREFWGISKSFSTNVVVYGITTSTASTLPVGLLTFSWPLMRRALNIGDVAWMITSQSFMRTAWLVKETGSALGGHLLEARIRSTCEIGSRKVRRTSVIRWTLNLASP